MKLILNLVIALLLAPMAALHGADKSPSPDKTAVTFRTADTKLQQLFNAAESQAVANLKPFSPTMTILVGGGSWKAAYIETQPMGGAMYAKRNVNVALNNQLIFMDRQREDGVNWEHMGPVIHHAPWHIWAMRVWKVEDRL
jgi:hypothetical protein